MGVNRDLLRGLPSSDDKFHLEYSDLLNGKKRTYRVAHGVLKIIGFMDCCQSMLSLSRPDGILEDCLTLTKMERVWAIFGSVFKGTPTLKAAVPVNSKQDLYRVHEPLCGIVHFVDDKEDDNVFKLIDELGLDVYKDIANVGTISEPVSQLIVFSVQYTSPTVGENKARVSLCGWFRDGNRRLVQGDYDLTTCHVNRHDGGNDADI